MEKDQASWTALGVAYLRAYHFKRHEPKVFFDTCAWELITEDERESFNEIALAAFENEDSKDADGDRIGVGGARVFSDRGSRSGRAIPAIVRRP